MPANKRPLLSVDTTGSEKLRQWLPLIFATAAYLILITRTVSILRDSDIYWHIVIGQWIIENRAVPHVDLFSFTMRGEPWITSAWLSEIIYYAAFKLGGWAGPALLAALSASVAFFLLTFFLLKRLPNVPVMILVTATITMTMHRVLARPHILIYPIMVLWVNALLQATEERRAPSLIYLPLITLWANLHGSFTLGLVLIAPFALEALWTEEKSGRRLRMILHWLRFGALAVGAACITPYGIESILVTFRIFDLGAALSNIGEWKALDVASPNPITVCALAGLAYALYTGFRLSPIRIALLVGLIYETFAHIRYVDVSAFVVPFLIAGPLARHLSWTPKEQEANVVSQVRAKEVAVLATLVLATGVILATTPYRPPLAPEAAVQKIKELKKDRVFNEYYFGGYLIFHGVPTFIDSRAELFRSAFLNRYVRALALDDLADFLRLLDEHKIDATLLYPPTPAVLLLDTLPGWQRVYSDDKSVIHIRRASPKNSDYEKR